MQRVVDSLQYARGYGLRYALIMQNRAQLMATYGSQKATDVFDNAGAELAVSWPYFVARARPGDSAIFAGPGKREPPTRNAWLPAACGRLTLPIRHDAGSDDFRARSASLLPRDP